MQGEDIIACGKISGGEGNERGRRIDVETDTWKRGGHMKGVRESLRNEGGDE